MGIANISGNILTDSGTNLSSLVSGSGTTNYLPKFTSASTIGNSLIQDNGTTITLGGALSGTGATFSGSVLANTSFKVNNNIGYLLRTDNDGANLGGFSRRSYWAGGAALDTQIFAETGYGIYLNVDGGSTKGLYITSGGNLQITASDSALYTRAAAAGKAIYWDIRNSADARRAYIGFGGDGSSDFQFSNNENGSQAFITNGTERMRITSGGNLLLTGGVSTGVTDTKFLMISQGTTSSTFAMVIKQSNNTTNLFLVRDDGLIQTGTASGSPYNNTSGAAANLVVNSAGTLERATSSLKYKKDVKDYNKGLAEVMAMRPVYYKGISESDGDKQYAGLIAEEIDALGLNEFVTYAEDGTPDALAYQNMIALLTKAIQELNDKVTALENK